MRVVPAAFLLAIAIGTIVLMLPAATASGTSAGFVTALFTATSAICVTGLVTVDTPTFWSGFGQVSILAMFQIGGRGIMTAATLLGLAAGRKLGSGLIDQSQKMMVAARATAEKKAFGHRS